jgi:2-methylcitrate dehydratase PrpD
MLDGLGREWLWQGLAFKPYACGTMAHPFIDCARALRRRGVGADAIERIDCDTAEGIVHRLWEPLAAKRQPPNGYAAKFSIPYAIACGFLRDDAGLAEYDDGGVDDPQLRALAQKVHYRIDPQDPYPERFVGHVRVTLRDGRVLEERQDHFRGGVDHPMGDDALAQKFFANCAYAGMPAAEAGTLAATLRALFDAREVKL